MKLAVLISWLACAAAVRAGTITGIVKAHGVEAPAAAGGGGAYGSMRYKFAEKVNYDALEDFVISIDGAVAGGGPGPEARMSQHAVAFEPHVLAIAAGTHVLWPNLDGIYHNVFSMSDPATFDLGLKSDKDAPAEQVFDHPGRIDVFCSIHSKMHGIILVLPNRFFAKVSARHRYALTGVPPGTYHLHAWQERLPPQDKPVTVTADGTAVVDFDLGFESLRK